MRLIVAGGRDYVGTQADKDRLEQVCIEHNVTRIISGGARGADMWGADFAYDHGLPCTTYEADWDKNGRAAGPLRNRKMAENADAVFLLPGGRGTASMRAIAKEVGIPILYDAGAPR